jgi:hypothetical protein
MNRTPVLAPPTLAALPSTRAIETRSLPSSLAATHCGFALITRTAGACASYPSCVAVYPRDSQSRRVLCRFPQKLHSLDRDVFYACHDVASAKVGH